MCTETHLNTALLLSFINADVAMGNRHLIYSDYDALSEILSHGEYILVAKGTVHIPPQVHREPS